MPDVVDAVKRKVNAGCQVTRCRKQGCSLGMKGAPANYVLIDLDRDDAPVRDNQARCDYIFVGRTATDCVAALELKAGKPDASEVVSQLRAWARIAERIMPQSSQVRFAAIAVFGGGLHRKERVDLLKRRNRITFRGESSPVTLVRCGVALASALRSAGLG